MPGGLEGRYDHNPEGRDDAHVYDHITLELPKKQGQVGYVHVRIVGHLLHQTTSEDYLN